MRRRISEAVPTSRCGGVNEARVQDGSASVGVSAFGANSDKVPPAVFDELPVRTRREKIPVDQDFSRPKFEVWVIGISTLVAISPSSAVTTSAMFGYRSEGDFATIFMQTCSSGEPSTMSRLIADGLGGILVPIWFKIEVSEPLNGNWPVSM